MKNEIWQSRDIASKTALLAILMFFVGCLLHPSMTVHSAFICGGVAMGCVSIVLYWDAADEKREKGR